MELLVRKHRRRPLELQLTAMIDIFSMIVIFLIFGTIFGAAEVVIPSQFKLPKSISKEGVDSAPRVVIHSDHVTTSLSEDKFSLKLFSRSDSASQPQSLVAMIGKIKDHLKTAPKDTKASGAMLNVVADAATPYKDIFDVVRFFREQGFDTLLFVATGEGKSK